MGEEASGLKRLIDDIYIAGNFPALYFGKEDLLVIADIHLGYEEAMASLGVYLPRLQLKKAVSLVKDLRGVVPARRLLVNGDIKHAFNKLLRQERIEVRKFVEECVNAGYRELLFVRGNHDNYVTPLLRDQGVEVFEEGVGAGEVLFTHGHRDPNAGSEVIVIGHEHPAVQVNVGGSKIKLPAFLVVPLVTGETVIVLPASGIYQTGNVITLDRQAYLSPIIRERGDLDAAQAVIVDEALGVIHIPSLRALSEEGLASP